MARLSPIREFIRAKLRPGMFIHLWTSQDGIGVVEVIEIEGNNVRYREWRPVVIGHTDCQPVNYLYNWGTAENDFTYLRDLTNARSEITLMETFTIPSGGAIFNRGYKVVEDFHKAFKGK